MGIQMSCCTNAKPDNRSEINNLSSPFPSTQQNSLTTEITESERIYSNIKKSRDPFESYSLALFQRINDFRKEPFKFYAESKQYNLSNMWEEIIKREKNLKQVAWSQKKSNFIKEIMDNKNVNIEEKLSEIKKEYSHHYNMNIYMASGNFIVIDQAIWDVFKRYCDDKDKALLFLTENYDYCVIYSTNNKYDGLIKEDNKHSTYKKDSVSSDEVTSFFFFFKYKKRI